MRHALDFMLYWCGLGGTLIITGWVAVQSYIIAQRSVRRAQPEPTLVVRPATVIPFTLRRREDSQPPPTPEPPPAG